MERYKQNNFFSIFLKNIFSFLIFCENLTNIFFWVQTFFLMDLFEIKKAAFETTVQYVSTKINDSKIITYDN